MKQYSGTLGALIFFALMIHAPIAQASKCPNLAGSYQEVDKSLKAISEDLVTIRQDADIMIMQSENLALQFGLKGEIFVVDLLDGAMLYQVTCTPRTITVESIIMFEDGEEQLVRTVLTKTKYGFNRAVLSEAVKAVDEVRYRKVD